MVLGPKDNRTVTRISKSEGAINFLRAEFRVFAAVLLLAASCSVVWPQNATANKAVSRAQAHRVYIGFDKNDYPGDELLAALHQTFAFTGYWLNSPPGATTNAMGRQTWADSR